MSKSPNETAGTYASDYCDNAMHYRCSGLKCGCQCHDCYHIRPVEPTPPSREFEPAFDPVLKPQGYNSHPSGVECLTITRHMNFNRGNALKYIWRTGIKPDTDPIDDLNKAIFYLMDEIRRLGGEPKWVERDAGGVLPNSQDG